MTPSDRDRQLIAGAFLEAAKGQQINAELLFHTMEGVCSAARNEAIEGAALIADRYPHWEHASSGGVDAQACCEMIAQQIRNLKT